MSMPEERTCENVKKILRFDSGETFYVELCLNNVSPQISKTTIISILDTLFENAKKTIR